MKKLLAILLAATTFLSAGAVASFAEETAPTVVHVEFEECAETVSEMKDAGLRVDTLSPQGGGDYFTADTKYLGCWGITEGTTYTFRFSVETAGSYSVKLGWVSHESSYGIWDIAVNGTQVYDDLSTLNASLPNRCFLTDGSVNVELTAGENTISVTALRPDEDGAGKNVLKFDYIEFTLIEAAPEGGEDSDGDQTDGDQTDGDQDGNTDTEKPTVTPPDTGDVFPIIASISLIAIAGIVWMSKKRIRG